ncbi:peritrophin-48-like [Lucilia sericata]|uniref:peritrophin-48-like n=1 Tax=Lucilia sericata TaxID=13632 RepID=UPI0018A8802C|nr:peritrophin-48-like [Lucilia sericata]
MAQLGQTGFCPVGQMFNQTEQRCIYDNGKCDKTFDICKVAKTSVSIWDENNCHKYYECDKNEALQEKNCTLGNYYDARSGDCIEKAKVNCYKHPIPDYACGNPKLAILNAFVKDQATCRGFFYCKSKPKKTEKDGSWNYDPDEKPTWGQCQKNFFFDEETQYCRDQNYVKCDEDRCDGHMSGKVLSEKTWL